MSIDDDDLERAGTRSRRQLSNSKQYSVYPPPSPPPSKHSLETKRLSLKKNHKAPPRSITLIIIFFILFIFYLIFSFKTHTRKQTSVFEQSTEYNDSSQFTHYALLNKLFSEKNGITSSRVDVNRLDTLNPGQNQFLTQLSKGHTFDQLRRLTHSITLPSTSMNKQHRRVPVTAIVHTKTVTQLYIQVQSVLTQTALPEHIWILCDTEQKSEVEARIMTLDRRRVKILARDRMDATPNQWLQIMSHISTDFVWLIDQDIVPGKRYLENLIKLSMTKQYQSALLGTEAVMLKRENGRTVVECIPALMHSESKQMKSQVVDMILDSWLLHRSWVPYLLDALQKTTSVEPLTGLFISRVLSMNAGIPSIALPTDPIERAYWGDVRLQKAKKSDTCKSVEKFIQKKPLDLFYRSQGTKSPVFIYMDSLKALENLSPLVCRFASSKEDLHIVIGTGLLSDRQVKSYLPHSCSQSIVKVVIHDLSLVSTGDSTSSSSSSSSNDLLHRLTRIMSVIQPKVLIHTVDKENLFYSSIQSACKIADVTNIYLPTQDIPHVLWMTELPIDTLSKWNSFSIKLLINTDKKPHALARLLNSASAAHYLGDDVELTILMDYSTDQVTQTFVNNYNWKFGPKSVRHRIAQASQSHLFVESWYPASNHEYALILNNEIELSVYYYSWLKYTVLKYRYLEPENTTTKDMFGISLYTPPLIETDPKGRYPFDPNHVLTESNLTQNTPFLMQWPSYSGALFFPEHWREFHDYITARTADIHGFDMQDIRVPELRSNDWVKSWRRYFEELIYLRGYSMLYPNFKNKKSLSTHHLELRKQKMREEYQDAISIFDLPLMTQDDDDDEMRQLLLDLPSFDHLPIFDLWGKITNGEQLKERGLEFHDEISSCPAPILLEGEENQFDPADLLCPFARIVTLSVNDENDPLPELPTLEVTVYN
ncbi:hypothetical protein BD770DRAFT_345109 [Pilaira anomala]|nr:hypothetical protein BD770DRAFT_345109 [Pilaira anomala]